MTPPVYAIDFETYYDKDYSLTKFSPEAYCRHEKFDAYLVSLVGPGVSFVGHPKDAPWQDVPRDAVFVAHNARFDETVLHRTVDLEHVTRGAIHPFFCTADLAVFLKAGRSLADACTNLLGLTPDKTVRKKMQTLGYKAACERGMKDALHAYALQDAERCLELWTKFSPGWPEHEREISRLNRESGRHGIRIDTHLLEDGIGALSTAKWEAERSIPWEWEENKTPLSPTKLAQACANEGIPCPGSVAEDSPECDKWMEVYGEKYPWISNLRRWRKAHGLLKKLLRIKNGLIDGDIFPFQIKYFGAHSGRFSGDGGFNMQNMIDGEREGVRLRSMFIPRPGKIFLAPDYSQIEARILQWYAGNKPMLARMAQGMSIYEAYARAVGSYCVEGSLKVNAPELYKMTKMVVLACGFQMGPERYKAQALEKYGVDLSLAEAKKQVYGFRDENPGVVGLWNRMNRDLIWSGQRGEPFIVGLPSGRQMIYRNIRQGRRGWESQVEINGNHYNTYGGLITENLCQATARDVMCEGMLRLDAAGYRVLFTVHDELIIECDPDVDQNEIRSLLIQSPDWLQGCPLDVEMKVLHRYE